MASRQLVAFMGVAAVAGAAGLALGMLLAPSSGAETRRWIRRRLLEETDAMARRGQRAVTHAAEYIEDQVQEGKRKLTKVMS